MFTFNSVKNINITLHASAGNPSNKERQLSCCRTYAVNMTETNRFRA